MKRVIIKAVAVKGLVPVVFSFIYFSAFAQEKGVIDDVYLPAQYAHYQEEYTLDKPVNNQAWKELKSGLHISFAPAEKSYFRTEVPVQNELLTWSATGWKGERLNTQVLVWSTDTVDQVHLIVGDLKNEKGKTISRQSLNYQVIRYVLSNYPYGAKDAVCGETPYKNGYLMPDRLEPLDRFNLPGHTVRPIWLSLNIPPTADPGLYTGEIEVRTGNNNRSILKLQIKVQGLLLPPPHEWKYRLDLWQNPWVVAWHNHVKPWSDEHKALLKKHLELYAQAGGKYITTYGVHSPWADNSYMIEGGMIDWIRQRNDKWKFDYTIFDTYVELAMQSGVDKAITIYTAVPWGDRFRIKEEQTGNYVYETWPPDSKLYKEHWNIFLTDLRKHLEQKGWFKKTYIGINESEMKETLAAIKVIKEHSKDWRITYAGNWHPELDSLLDDYSYLYGNEPNPEQINQRSKRGATSTFYVCCNPPKPNNFVFSPPIEGRWISWYSAACGYDGFLRWAYDAWPEDPIRDARFGSWPAGDCFIVYPGGNSSIRFETLREGIADYEKISMLRTLVLKSDDKVVKDLWGQLEQHLKIFTKEHDFVEEKIAGDVEKGKELIANITDRLEHKSVL